MFVSTNTQLAIWLSLGLLGWSGVVMPKAASPGVAIAIESDAIEPKHTIRSSSTALVTQGQGSTAAERSQEAWQFYREGREESLMRAISLWEEAYQLYQQSSDPANAAAILYNIGIAYDSLGDAEQALAFYNRALPLFRSVGDRPSAAAALNRIGAIYQFLREQEQALEFYHQALSIWQAVDDRAEAANTLTNIGAVYNALGETAQALEVYHQALSLWQAVDDRAREANTLNHIGLIYYALGDREQALEFYHQALPLRRAVDDRAGEAATLTSMGAVYHARDDHEQALAFYLQALPLWQAVDDRAGEASTLSSLGLIYQTLGDRESALVFYQQALPLFRAGGDRAGEATTLNNVGLIYHALGEREQALEFYHQALPLFQAGGDRAGEANILTNIGIVYDALGEKEQALEFYHQALPLFQAGGDRAGEADILSNIGVIYDALGEKGQALEFYNEALRLRSGVGDRAGEATTLTNIGVVYSTLGLKDLALEVYQRALLIRQDMDDQPGEAATLHNMGSVYDALGEHEQALAFYQQALLLRRTVGDRAGAAATLTNIGAVYHALGDRGQALEFYNEALPLRQAVGDRAGEAITLYSIARIYRERDDLSAALDYIDEAIALTEDLRTDVSPGDLRTTYFATVQERYQLKLDLLMALGREQAAFETSEATRARTLIELLNEANIDIRQGVDPQLLAQEQDLQQQLQAIEIQRKEVLSREHTQADRDDLDQKSDDLLAQLDQVIAQIRRESPAYAEIVDPEPLNLNQIRQQVLDDETVLVQYALGHDQSYLWLVGTEQLQHYTLPGEGEIDTAVRTFLSTLKGTGNTVIDTQRTGHTLRDLILPELPDWTAGKRLIVVADGGLSQIPFGALPVSGEPDYVPLLRDHEILSQPSATAIAVLRQQFGDRPPAPRAIAMLADPVYDADDQRVAQRATPDRLATVSNAEASGRAASPLALSTPNTAVELDRLRVERNLRDLDLRHITRLPHTRTEAEAILSLFENDENDQISAVYGFDANDAWVQTANLDEYQMVHLATHGFINVVNPQLSGVLLSLVNEAGESQADGFLRLHDIFNLELNAELVVLSACQTGLGEEVQGEGMIGLSRGLMYAGAKRIAVSLWNVNDAATAELMALFYRTMLEAEMTPAAALRTAQLQLWEAGEKPYYWAAFTVQGEWQ